METSIRKKTFGQRLKRDMRENWVVYLLLLPVVVWYIVFCYLPMFGIVMAFENFKFAKGIFGSAWVGFKNFEKFFSSYYFVRLLRNTIVLSVKDLIFSFPAPIIFALMLNELRNQRFKKSIQTISYLPYFISMVVVCGLVKTFTESTGVFSMISQALGGPKELITNPESFHGIMISSGIWQNLGYGSVIYISALTAIDQELYDSAKLDGANRWQQTLHVTLPGIMPTIIIMLIMRVGHLMSVNYQKIILLYSPATYETADTISTFVYRKGLMDGDYSYAAAVDLFNSVINTFLLVGVNWISRKKSDTSLF